MCVHWGEGHPSHVTFAWQVVSSACGRDRLNRNKTGNKDTNMRNDDNLDWADDNTPGESWTEMKTIRKGHGTLYYTNRDGGERRRKNDENFKAWENTWIRKPF